MKYMCVCLRRPFCYSIAKLCQTLQPHGQQLANFPCPSLSPWVYSSSGPLSCWCYLTISSFVTRFSSCPFPASRSFLRVSSLHQVAKVLELQHQSFQWIFRDDFFRIDWFDLLAVQGTLRSLLQHHRWKASILWHSAFMVQLSSVHDYSKRRPFKHI